MQSSPTATLNSELAYIIKCHWGYKDDGLIPNPVYFEKSSIIGENRQSCGIHLRITASGGEQREYIINTKYHHY